MRKFTVTTISNLGSLTNITVTGTAVFKTLGFRDIRIVDICNLSVGAAITVTASTSTQIIERVI